MGIEQQHDKIRKDVLEALKNGFFNANGVRYNILAPESMSGARYAHFQRAEIETAFGITIQQIFNNNNEIVEVCNNWERLGDTMKIREIALNQNKNIINFQSQPDYSAIELFCTIFILKEGENEKQYDISNIDVKIKDWREEGIPNGFFHLLASSIMRGYRELLTLTLHELNRTKLFQDDTATELKTEN